MEKKLDLVVDMQFGSTGKGLIAGYLAEKNEYDVVMTANMPNAGHTYINDDGRKWMHKVLPNGIVSPKLNHVMIGAGAVFDPERLWEEMYESSDFIHWLGLESKMDFKDPANGETRRSVQLMIHPNAVCLSDSHREHEKKTLSGISSTMQGSMAALVDKMQRSPERNFLAGHVGKGKWFETQVTDHATWRRTLLCATSILAEGAQGYSLGLSQEFWPFCTSRDCTPARFLADMGVPVKMLRKTIGTARVHPIRVGNTPDGYSGDTYADQTELTWDELQQVPELTTVTQRVRRVFTYSSQQIMAAAFECAPDEVFLNFCNYDVTTAAEVEKDINSIGQYLGLAEGVPLVRYLGFGPARHEVKEV